jgi:prolyl-tRNA synthetase
MKDSYSFDIDGDGLDKSYHLHDQAYRRIFERCGLRYLSVRASSGAMGGSESEEFMVYSDAGEDWIVSCSDCGYAANLERACAAPDEPDEPAVQLDPEEVHTPGQKTIEEVSAFLKLPKRNHIKSLVYVVDSQPHLILIRGDHHLSELKLATVLGTETFRPATSEEIRGAFGADPGSLGPVGVRDMAIIADAALEGRHSLVCGANRDDYHLINVTPGRDFTTIFANLREVQKGDPCPECRSPLEVAKAIEVGHIFKLGLRYSQAMGATVLNREGQEVPIVMGSYGIGVERILASAVELYHDELGMILPRSIAPFQVVITILRPDDPEQVKVVGEFSREFENRGIDFIIDDRDERPGVKFKDAELVGIPIRITVGKKLQQGEVELFSRSERKSTTVPVAEAVDQVSALLEAYTV